MKHSTSVRGYLIAAASAFVWAGTSPGIAFLLSRNIPGLTIALWRDVVITLFLAVILLATRPGLLRVSRRDLRELGIAGMVSIGLYHALWVWSVMLNGAAIAVVLIYLYPAFVTLGSWVLYRERVSPAQLLALGLSLIGCAFVVRAYDPALLRLNALGLIVGLLTALTHTVYVLFNHRRVQTLSTWTSLTYMMGFGALALAVLTLVVMPSSLAPPADATSAIVLILLSLGPTMGGYGLFTLSLRFVPAQIASVIVVLEVPIAALIAVVFLGERLEPPQLIGMALVMIAAVLPSLAAEWSARRTSAEQVAVAPGSK